MSGQTVVVLGGDGIGPEVTDAALAVLRRVAGDVDFDERLVGVSAIRADGTALSAATLAACKRADAVLVGALGDPGFPPGSDPDPGEALLTLRSELGVTVNLRPIAARSTLAELGPIRASHVQDVDFLIVRELSGGLYRGGRHARDARAALDECVYTREQVERAARVAFGAARTRVTSVDKANVLETSRLWREVVTEVAREFPEIELEHMLVDNAAMQLLLDARRFDVLLTENLFGDVLSDEASIYCGSIGMLPSASLGTDGSPGLFEPAHGSAPDIAGLGVANPVGAILSGAMLLRHGLDRTAAADAVERAVAAAIDAGTRTRDLQGTATTGEFTAAVLEAL
ncbi:3-isopropylmalate dehydrogenase [Patulibacter medicamentivorans]|uniref:3-isopropylmalate dehydrogenase n=1 Tax=Patulibacter medicamentivorans TaxID=1097667 RepID=H0E079_9ACTN|nr:3-isopropylmalate dehydrogenase [Patulibacter medicamentivorans]EHN12882.1 3-isopropylmalate dehydrogenase [Patulibacter medicamentivorans]